MSEEMGPVEPDVRELATRAGEALLKLLPDSMGFALLIGQGATKTGAVGYAASVSRDLAADLFCQWLLGRAGDERDHLDRARAVDWIRRHSVAVGELLNVARGDSATLLQMRRWLDELVTTLGFKNIEEGGPDEVLAKVKALQQAPLDKTLVRQIRADERERCRQACLVRAKGWQDGSLNPGYQQTSPDQRFYEAHACARAIEEIEPVVVRDDCRGHALDVTLPRAARYDEVLPKDGPIYFSNELPKGTRFELEWLGSGELRITVGSTNTIHRYSGDLNNYSRLYDALVAFAEREGISPYVEHGPSQPAPDAWHACSHTPSYDPETLEPQGPECRARATAWLYWKDGRVSPSCPAHGLDSLDPDARALVLRVEPITSERGCSSAPKVIP